MELELPPLFGKRMRRLGSVFCRVLVCGIVFVGVSSLPALAVLGLIERPPWMALLASLAAGIPAGLWTAAHLYRILISEKRFNCLGCGELAARAIPYSSERDSGWTHSFSFECDRCGLADG